MVLTVTLTLAAACALINLWLAMRLVPRRLNGIPLGDGGDAGMMAGMRSHANFAEYAPIVLVLSGLIELARGPSVWLWGLAGAFVLARLMHPIGMGIAGRNVWRAGGAVATWAVTLALAGWAVAIALDAAADRPGPAVETVAPTA